MRWMQPNSCHCDKLPLLALSHAGAAIWLSVPFATANLAEPLGVSIVQGQKVQL